MHLCPREDVGKPQEIGVALLILRRWLCGHALTPLGVSHTHYAHAHYTPHPTVPGSPLVGIVDPTHVYRWTRPAEEGGGGLD